jgi:hypothetical protein
LLGIKWRDRKVSGSVHTIHFSKSFNIVSWQMFCPLCYKLFHGYGLCIVSRVGHFYGAGFVIF